MYQKNKQGCLFYQKPQQAGMEILGCAQNDTCPAKSDTYPAKSGTWKALSDTYAKRAEQGKKRHSQVRL